MSSDNALRPVKPSFARSLLCPYDDSVVNGSSVKLPAAAASSSSSSGETVWATFPTTCGVTTSYGTFSYTVAIDAKGSSGKPMIVGLVPRNFTGFDAKLGQGGWGVGSTGKIYAYNAAAAAKSDPLPSMAFGPGDKVTVKVDCSKCAITFVVEPKKGKASDHTIKVPTLGGPGSWVVPAVSLASPGSGATFESLTDTTPLDAFGARLADAEDLCFECCALGNYFLRWFRRMDDNQTVKAGGATLTKADVRLRAVLFGSETTPSWGRSPLAGIFDCDSTRRKMAGLYSEACHSVIRDSVEAKKLSDMIKTPPANLRMLVLRCSGPVALGMALAQAAAPEEKDSPFTSSPAVKQSVALSESTASEKQLTAQLKQLQDRVHDLEHQGGPHSPEPTALNVTAPSSSNLRRTASKAGGPAAVPAGTRRRSSVSGGATAPGRVVAAKRPMSRTLARPTAKKPASTPKASKPGGSTTTSNTLLNTIRGVRKLLDEHHTVAQKGSPTDADMKQMRTLEDAIAKAKVKAARDIAALDTKQVEKFCDDDTKAEIGELLEEVVPKGDQVAGSIELVQTLLRKVTPMDYATVVKELNLAAMAAYDGSVEFLKLFLSVPKLSIDLVELVECAIFNQTHRIPVTALLVDMWETLGLNSVVDDISDAWQEFFEDICSAERAKDREDRTGRLALVTKMLKMKSPKADPMAEGSDGQTPFSRAAREGDMDLMTTLISNAASVIDINHVSSIDKTTALIQAVMKNRTHIVKALASLPTLDRTHECEEGSALSIAKALQRDPEIIKALS